MNTMCDWRLGGEGKLVFTTVLIMKQILALQQNTVSKMWHFQMGKLRSPDSNDVNKTTAAELSTNGDIYSCIGFTKNNNRSK